MILGTRAAFRGRRVRHGVRRRAVGASGLLLVALVSGACGGDDGQQIGAALIGDAVLPNLVPEPPAIINMLRNANGEWELRFESVLVNTGEGDFELSSVRQGDTWVVSQLVRHSEQGVEVVPTDATMVWGGDGHQHWHVERVASYRLEPIDDDGVTPPGTVSRSDTKIGFCFFDSGKELDRGPANAQYQIGGCGHEDDTTTSMGLSPGWGDTYTFDLPGQSIQVGDLPDGLYRLWAEADERGWFTEETRDDNLTWADIELGTRGEVRTARVVDVGPEPK